MTPPRRSSWLIVNAAAKELARQASDGLLTHCGKLDYSGHIQVNGTLDIARLALAVEAGLRAEFYGSAPENGGAL